MDAETIKNSLKSLTTGEGRGQQIEWAYKYHRKELYKAIKDMKLVTAEDVVKFIGEPRD